MRLTASGLSRAESCIGSVILPGFDESGEYAATGSAVDRFVQTAKTKSKAAALAEAPEEMRPYLDGLTIERIPDGAEYQAAFALNVLTGEVRRIAGRGEGYPADLGEEWIFGTSDIVGARDGRGLVWDLKWGTSTIGRDPADDLQLGFYALAVAGYTGLDEVEVGFLRAGWDGVLRPEVALLDEMALDALRERIRAIWLRAHGGQAPRLNVGEHCTYCNARRSCPALEQPVSLALRGELGALAAEELPALEVVREEVTALALIDKGRLYERLDAAEDFLKLVRGILRDDAKREAIPLSGGKELREVQWGVLQSSPVAKAEIEALKADLKARGEIKTVKGPQVRPMKARA